MQDGSILPEVGYPSVAAEPGGEQLGLAEKTLPLIAKEITDLPVSPQTQDEKRLRLHKLAFFWSGFEMYIGDNADIILPDNLKGKRMDPESKKRHVLVIIEDERRRKKDDKGGFATKTILEASPDGSSPEKLIRDKVAEIMKKSGVRFSTHPASPSEFIQALYNKMLEETTELIKARGRDKITEELADIQEVFIVLLEHTNISIGQIRGVIQSTQSGRSMV